MKRIHRWDTVDGIIYSYTDGKRVTEAEWIAQCQRWEEEHQERERKEQERTKNLVYGIDTYVDWLNKSRRDGTINSPYERKHLFGTRR